MPVQFSRPPRFGMAKTLALTATAGLAAALAVAACGRGDPAKQENPLNLGGDSQVVGFTPTPTARQPATKPAQPTATSAPTQPGGTTPGPTTPGGGGGNTEAGKQVFQTKGCTACHTAPGAPGGNVGPNLGGIGTRAGTRKPGTSADAYIRESIQAPGAFVVSGFGNLMPPGLVQPGPDLDNLVAFLLSLQ